MSIREAQLQAHMMIGLTPEGKQAAQQALVKGGSFSILAYLAEHAPRSIHDIAEYTGMDMAEVKTRIRMMAQYGYVRVAASE